MPSNFTAAAQTATADWNAKATCYYLQQVSYPTASDIYIGNTTNPGTACGKNTAMLGDYPHGIFINYANASTQGTSGMASLITHEIGHSFGLLNADDGCSRFSTIMMGYTAAGPTNTCKQVNTVITAADVAKSNQNCTMKSTCDRSGGSGSDEVSYSCPTDNGCSGYDTNSNPLRNPDECNYPTSQGYYDGCPSGSSLQQQGGDPNMRCCVQDWSPILLDISGNGFELTDPAHGVLFDLDGNGKKERLSWTSPHAENGWLVLDRNGDGRIGSGLELFGNFSVQPPSAQPNGFRALGVYDEPGSGGNGNGVIDAGDTVFKSLKVWIDRNHNGVSEAEELYSLNAVNIVSISLNYEASHWTDRFGNAFRYRARVNFSNSRSDRWTYDVFLRKGR